MDQRTQRDYIKWRAPELASSGHFRDWAGIVRMLRYEGVYSAHIELTKPYWRDKLNRLCDEARTTLDKTYKAYLFLDGDPEHFGESPQGLTTIDEARDQGKWAALSPTGLRPDYFIIKSSDGEIAEQWHRQGDDWEPSNA